MIDNSQKWALNAVLIALSGTSLDAGIQMSDTPKTLVTNQTIPPIAYIVELKTIHCTNCHTNHEHSDAYELRIYRNYKNLHPLRSMGDVNYNMPIQVDRKGPTFTAFCHECVKPGMLNHLPRPPKAQFIPPSWVGTGDPKDPYGDKKKSVPKARGPAPRLTIDDLD